MKSIFNCLRVFLLFISVIIFGCQNSIKVSKDSVWSIGVYAGKDPLHLHEVDSINNPVLEASDVTDADASFIADPFLWNYESKWYMFFEVLNKKDMKGDIGYAYSTDCKEWNYGKLILDRKDHLSYPYIFESNGTIFMLPENAESGHLILYVAKNFPEEWEIFDTLLIGSFGDHAIFRYNNMWWLMACSEPKKNNVLKLFYSDSLNGSWVEHPKSPIVEKNADKARPAGRVLVLNDSIIRFAQDCKPTYGGAVNAFLITSLDKHTYSEIPAMSIPVIKNELHTWAGHGMHQVDAHRINDSTWIAAVDGYKKIFSISMDY